MATYRWTMGIEVDAEDDIEAEERIGEMLDNVFWDPDGPVSYGKLERQVLSENVIGAIIWQEVSKGKEVKGE